MVPELQEAVGGRLTRPRWRDWFEKSGPQSGAVSLRGLADAAPIR
jgi:hypothetical protein